MKFYLRDIELANKNRKEGMEEGIQKGMKKGMKKGREEGRKEGIQKGREEGRKEGIQKGMKKGIEKEKYKNARNLLGLLDNNTIAKSLELPLDVVNNMYNEVFGSSAN